MPGPTVCVCMRSTIVYGSVDRSSPAFVFALKPHTTHTTMKYSLRAFRSTNVNSLDRSRTLDCKNERERERNKGSRRHAPTILQLNMFYGWRQFHHKNEYEMPTNQFKKSKSTDEDVKKDNNCRRCTMNFSLEKSDYGLATFGRFVSS